MWPLHLLSHCLFLKTFLDILKTSLVPQDFLPFSSAMSSLDCPRLLTGKRNPSLHPPTHFFSFLLSIYQLPRMPAPGGQGYFVCFVE